MHEKSPSMQIINRHLRVRQKHIFIDYKMPFVSNANIN